MKRSHTHTPEITERTRMKCWSVGKQRTIFRRVLPLAFRLRVPSHTAELPWPAGRCHCSIASEGTEARSAAVGPTCRPR